jgi:hypothetical protein
MGESLRLDAGHGLNLERAETFVSELAHAPMLSGSIELVLSNCRNVDVGAGWRLGNALRRAKPHSHLSVTVPNDGFSSSWWFRNFTRSGLGFSLARYADIVTADKKPITKELRNYYFGDRPTASATNLARCSWTAPNAVLVHSLDTGVVDPDDIGNFADTLLKLLPSVGFDPSAYEPEHQQQLFELMFQSVQNVYDHAAKAPLSANTEIFSYVSLRHYKEIENPKSKTPEFSEYLQMVEALPPSYDRDGYIEIVINDDGVGMAARQALDASIYWETVDAELLALTSALKAGQSVKPRSQDCLIRGDPGYGIPKIEAALKELLAFGLLRTGRLYYYLDPFKLNRFAMGSHALGCMPGTTLQIVLPCRKRTLWSRY